MLHKNDVHFYIELRLISMTMVLSGCIGLIAGVGGTALWQAGKVISEELVSVEKDLAEKEEKLKQYREKYMGELPGQLDTNLQFLERLHVKLDHRKRDLRTAENKKFLIKEEIAGSTLIDVDGKLIPADVSSLRNELASLELKYSDNHPDIIRLRKMIQ